MATELSRLSGKSYEKVLRLESASIIKICALKASIASKAAIQRDVQREVSTGRLRGQYDLGRVTINVKVSAGRVWFVPSGKTARRGPGGTFRMVFDAGPMVGPKRGWHLSDSEWVGYLMVVDGLREAAELRVAELVKRRGLMRLSWLQIGDQLGVPLATVSPQGNLQESIARAARGPGGRVFRNGTSRLSITGGSIAFTVRNESPLAIKRQGQASLDKAIAQRLKGFAIAVDKGVLQDLQLRAARWRGVFVRGR